MSTSGKFQIRENVLSDKSKTYDVLWRAASAPFEYALVFEAVDFDDARTRCDKLNEAIAEDWIDCDECGGSEKSGHMPGCSKHRNAALRRRSRRLP